MESLTALGYFDLFAKVHKIAEQQAIAFDWDDRENWGIQAGAWDAVAKREFPPALVFAHPKMLSMHPEFLKFYRCVACISQKGLAQVTGLSAIDGVERGRRRLEGNDLDSAVRTLNEFISLLLEMDPAIDKDKLGGMMFATAGTQVQGSWINKIGEEGERVIRNLVLRVLHEKQEITGLTFKDGGSISAADVGEKDLGSIVRRLRSIQVKNGSPSYSGRSPI